MNKTYPFSVTKHAHDIEFYYNRLFNTMCEMETGDIPMDKVRYDRIYDMYYGPLTELYERMFEASSVVWLTGEQIALAKRIIAWANETRAATQIRKQLEKGAFNNG